MKPYLTLITLATAAVFASPATGADRDTLVRDDRTNLAASSDWIYNDLAAGFRTAKESGKPVFVVLRCIP